MEKREERPLALEHEGWKREVTEASDRKEDPILEEFVFCETCEGNVLQLIDYIRNLENAQTVAKEALEMMIKAQKKLTKENQMLMQEAAMQKERAEQREKADLKARMREIDQKFQGRIDRDKLII